MIGRRSLLHDDPTLETTIVSAIQGGATYKAACEYAGVSLRALMEWRAAGRQAADRIETAERALAQLPANARKAVRRDAEVACQPTERERPYHALHVAVTKASARAEVAAAHHVIKAMSTDWKSAAWFLEHRNPQDWPSPNRKVEVEHSGGIAGGHGLDLSGLSDDELAILQKVVERQAVAPSNGHSVVDG